MRMTRIVVVVAVMGAVVSMAVAQQREQPGRDPGRDPRDPQRQQPGIEARDTDRADQQIAYCLVIDNWKEVQISQLAAEQAENEQVQQFARKMVEEHTQLMERLQQIAQTGEVQPGQRQPGQRQPGVGQPGQRQPGQRQDQRDERRTPDDDERQTDADPAQRQLDAQAQRQRDDAQRQRDPVQRQVRPDGRAAQRDRGQMQAGLNFLEVKRQIAEQCVQSARRDLEEKDGAEFDRAFMAMQVFAHSAMLDELTVFEQYALPELSQLIEQATQTTREHLEEAKQILQTLEDRDGRAAAQT